MSYILDALKKMEYEKARKNVPAGMTKITGDLFREDSRRPPQGGVWKLVAVAAAASLLAVAATWLFLAPTPKRADLAFHATAAPERMVAAVHAHSVPPSVAPRPPLPRAVQPPPQPAPLFVPSREIRKQELRTSQPGTASSFKASGSGELSRQRKDSNSPALPSSPENPVDATMVAPPAGINVSGIAWQDERGARRVVINGFLLKEGSVVAGSRISEILKDRVLFSRSGGKFEVVMTAPDNSASAPSPGNGTGR